MKNQLRSTTSVAGTGGRLSGHIYKSIKARLLQGEIPPNDRLSVEALRVEFGVSKQPVMEALRLLTADGLVEIVPQIGCVVSTYSPAEVEDFFHMFAGLEGAVAGVAARRCSQAALRELDTVSRRIRVLSTDPNPGIRSLEYLTLNRDFHERIHRMAGSRIIVDTSRRMWDLSDFLINTAGVSHPMGAAVGQRQDDHDRIREALAAGDPGVAKNRMENHILKTVELLQGRAPVVEGY